MVLTSCLIQVGVKQWLFATTPDICTEQSGNSLTCPRAKVFFTASVLWYVPARLRLCLLLVAG